MARFTSKIFITFTFLPTDYCLSQMICGSFCGLAPRRDRGWRNVCRWRISGWYMLKVFFKCSTAWVLA